MAQSSWRKPIIPPPAATDERFAKPSRAAFARIGRKIVHFCTRAGTNPLLLRIRIRPNRRFRVDGADLHVELPVSPWEAALGAEVPVPTLDGRAKVKVPAGTSSGRKLRLRGQGLQANGDRRAGDLYATVSIRVPKRLTKRERELFGQLASESKFDPRKNG